MTKFWVLMHNKKLVQHRLNDGVKLFSRGMPSPVYTDNRYTDKYAHFTEYEQAKEAAGLISKKYGGDVYIMELVAYSTVPCNIVGVE